MTPSARLLARVRALDLPVDIPPAAEIRRTYAGYWQRAQGAWSWSVWPAPSRGGIGSQQPVGELLRAARLIALRDHGGDWHIDPLDPGETPLTVAGLRLPEGWRRAELDSQR